MVETKTHGKKRSTYSAAGQTYEDAGFDQVRRAERRYGMQLRKIARHIGDIIATFPPGDPMADSLITKAMRQYSEMLHPWAKVTAAGMLADVTRRDERVWRQITEGMGNAMREYLQSAPLAPVLAELEAEQVRLITSLPTEAAERVHKLTVEGLSDAKRYTEVAKEIMRSGEVTQSRALLIARTEVGRASGKITEARATHVGSEGYIWRTVGDSDTRPSHRKLNGKFIRYDSPPTTDNLTYHAGCGPNCRCWQDVVLPPEFMSRR